MFALFIAILFSAAQFNKRVANIMETLGLWVASISIIGIITCVYMLVLRLVLAVLLHIPYFSNPDNVWVEVGVLAGVFVLLLLSCYLVYKKIRGLVRTEKSDGK